MLKIATTEQEVVTLFPARLDPTGSQQSAKLLTTSMIRLPV